MNTTLSVIIYMKDENRSIRAVPGNWIFQNVLFFSVFFFIGTYLVCFHPSNLVDESTVAKIHDLITENYQMFFMLIFSKLFLIFGAEIATILQV